MREWFSKPFSITMTPMEKVASLPYRHRFFMEIYAWGASAYHRLVSEILQEVQCMINEQLVISVTKRDLYSSVQISSGIESRQRD